MSDELLSQKDLQWLHRLQFDLDTAQLDAGVRPENKADALQALKGIRDRLKPYVQKINFMDKGLVARALKAILMMIHHIESLQAQNQVCASALSDISEIIDCPGPNCHECDTDQEHPLHFSAKIAQKALVALPVEAMQMYRKQQAVIEAAEAHMAQYGPDVDAFPKGEQAKSREALRAALKALREGA
jgi:hypothetical protein